MRTRYRIVTLLSLVTFTLGAFVFLLWHDDELAIIRFRWFLFNHPIRNLSDAVTSLVERNPGSLWYVGLSLVAMIIVGIVFRFITNAELRAFSDRLISAEVAKAELEAALQDSRWKEKHARAARDAALKDLEANSSGILALGDRLSETEKLLKSRERELLGLRSKAEALTEPPVEAASFRMREQTELRNELRKKADLLQAKDSAIHQLEKNLTEISDALETERHVNKKLVNERHKELEALRTQLTETKVAKSQAESFLAEELKREKQALQAKESASKELQKNLTAKVHALESQMSEKQELLQSRSTELEALKSEMTILTGRLTDLVSAKERTEKALQQELKNRTELLRSKDAAFKELQERSRAQVQALESQLADKDQLEKQRDKEQEALRTQLTKTGAAKSQAESFLAEELKKEKLALKAKDSAIKELEKNLTAKIHALESQLSEKQELLQSRATELEALRSEVTILTGRLTDVVSAKERTENALQQELKNKTELLRSKDAALKELQTGTAKVNHLENQLREKDVFLKDHSTELASLRAQLTKMGSAKKEIEDLLQEELRKAAEVLKAKDSTIKEIEASSKKTVDALKDGIGEQQNLLTRRDEELQALRSEVNSLQAQLATIGPVTEWEKTLLHEETSKQDGMKTFEESLKEVQSLESLLHEKEDLLKSHDQKIERLESELKERRTAMAKHEITVWQAYERRTIWKHRLAKFGISIKDREL